jgi:hypothetical protein
MFDFDEFELTPFKLFFALVASALVEYLAYISYNHIAHFTEIMKHTYSTGGELLNVIIWPFAVIMVVIGFILALVLAWFLIKLLYVAIIGLPDVIKNENDIIKRSWKNRGFAKYKLFGGISFYLKLRQRVFAYFFAFLAIGIVTWFFIFKQHTYEKTYWKINFYYKEPLPTFTFKPNKYYTIKTDADFYGIMINGNRYVTGKSTSWTQDENNKISLNLPKNWNIQFQDTTYIDFMFYSDHINEIFSQTLEVWEDVKDGYSILPSQFAYKHIENNISKPKKKKK